MGTGRVAVHGSNVREMVLANSTLDVRPYPKLQPLAGCVQLVHSGSVLKMILYCIYYRVLAPVVVQGGEGPQGAKCASVVLPGDGPQPLWGVCTYHEAPLAVPQLVSCAKNTFNVKRSGEIADM